MLAVRCFCFAAGSAATAHALAASFRGSHRADLEQSEPVRAQPEYKPARIALNFHYATVTCNNLGGKGPDADCDEMIYYQNVSVGYDLKFVATSDYVPKNTDNNGLDGDFGTMNLNKDQHVDMVATLIDAETGAEVTRGKSFYLTIWDMDQGNDRDDGTPKLVENVTVSPVHEWKAMPNPWFDTYEESADTYSFVSQSYGNSDNNPTDAWNITEEQKKRAASVYFEDRTRFYLTFTTSGGGSGGRNIMFGGDSWLTENVPKIVAPCEDYSDMVMSDGLIKEARLEDPGIRYLNATLTPEGAYADMLIRANSGYLAFNPGRNGVYGKCGEINVAKNTGSKFTVEFYKHNTNKRVTIDRLFFSVLDLDATAVGTEVLKISNESFIEYFTSATTELNITSDDDGLVTFAATEYGNFGDNPTDPKDLTPLQADRAVTFFMTDVSDFDLWFYDTKAFTGRNFLFAGATNMACPAQLR